MRTTYASNIFQMVLTMSWLYNLPVLHGSAPLYYGGIRKDPVTGHTAAVRPDDGGTHTYARPLGEWFGLFIQLSKSRYCTSPG